MADCPHRRRDNYLVREGTRRLLEDSGQVTVQAAVGSAPELLDAVRRARPDAVLTDIRMPAGPAADQAAGPAMEGIDAAHCIKATTPGVGVVILSQYADESYAFELFRNGTAGLAYLLKDRVGDLRQLLSALRGGGDGRIGHRPAGRRCAGHPAGRLRESPLALTRELDVLREMAQVAGMPASPGLFLSESSIERRTSTPSSPSSTSPLDSLPAGRPGLTFLRDRSLRPPG